MKKQVQTIGPYVIVHLGRFEGMPEELKDVRLFYSTAAGPASNERSQLFADEPGQPWSMPKEVPSPKEFVAGILAAAAELD